MIQGAIAAALKEVLGGITDELPKPPLGGQISMSVVFVIVDGKPQLKEGSEIGIDLKLMMGDED